MSLTIEHHPQGLGHPYAYSPNQRVPVHPIVRNDVWIGLETSRDAIAVRCEITCSDGTQQMLEAVRVNQCEGREGSDSTAIGHLAAAQSASLRVDGIAWEVTLRAVRDERYRYRAIAIDEQGNEAGTGWFEFHASSWRNDVSKLTVTRANGIMTPTVSNVQVLTEGTRCHRVRFQLPLRREEHVVGFGERYDALDQRGHAPDSIVFEQYKGQGKAHRTYFPMPFAHVIGGLGWGFYVRSSRRVWFDIGRTDSNAILIEAETDIDGELELDLFAGSPSQVLSAFLDLTGRASLLPAWVHRLWASGNEWNTQDAVMKQMELHRKYGIPVGVLVIEAWSDEQEITVFRDAQYSIDTTGAPRRGTDFTYPTDGAWPDPKSMVDELHANGVKVLLWQIPLLKSQETFDEEHQPHGRQVIIDGERMVRDGVAVREADGSPYHNRAWWFPKALMPDLSTKSGRDWWAARRVYLVRDIGIDGFKTDGGEHAWGADLRYDDGTSGEDGNNLNPVRYVQTYCDFMRSLNKPPITFSRSGFVGSQQYGIFWAGDEDSTWEAFRSSIRAGLSLCACGVVYWGWDMAGFSGPLPSPELFIRAVAASTFMPVMQYHSEFNHHEAPLRDRTPWNVAEQSGDDGVINDFRVFAKLRERLVPYLHAQAKRSIATGKPLMRALFFDAPHDDKVWCHPFEYMLGDMLLVNPICHEHVEQISTYLPEGEWVDVWTQERVMGGSILNTDVSRRTAIPVYCKAEGWPGLKDCFAGE